MMMMMMVWCDDADLLASDPAAATDMAHSLELVRVL